MLYMKYWLKAKIACLVRNFGRLKIKLIFYYLYLYNYFLQMLTNMKITWFCIFYFLFKKLQN